MRWWPPNLRNEAEIDAYIYFDRNIRGLSKKPDGSIDTLAPGFFDNDVDAFRHAYVSGVFTREYSENVANIFGVMNEWSSSASPPGGTNMDLWNNGVGRKLGMKAKNNEDLQELVKKSLTAGELIISLDDPRKFTDVVPTLPEGNYSVVVLRENDRGVNEFFYDLATSKAMNRTEFVVEIIAGRYPGYGVKHVNGVDYPFSKRDKDPSNNLG